MIKTYQFLCLREKDDDLQCMVIITNQYVYVHGMVHTSP